MVSRAVVKVRWRLVAGMIAAAFTGAAGAPAAIGAQTPVSVEALLALRDIGTIEGGLSLSPDGSHLAIVEWRMDLARNAYVYRLLVMPAAADATARAVGDGGGFLPHNEHGRPSGGPIERFPAWSPDNRQIAFIAERQGRGELWVSTIDGQTALAARPAGNVRRFAWASPSRLVFESATARETLAAARAHEAADGFRVDDQFDPSFGLRPFADVDGGAEIQSVDLRNKVVRTADASEGALLAPDHEALAAAASIIPRAWVAPRDPTSRAAHPPSGVFVGGGGHAPRMCAAAECGGYIRESGVFADGRVWFLKNEGFADGEVALYVWTPATGAVRRLRRANELLTGCVNTQTAFFCIEEASEQPRRIVRIDATTGALALVFDPNPAWINHALPRIERLTFRDTHGLESYGDLVYPLHYIGGRRYPMVIVQYRSRGFLRGGVGGEYPVLPLSARGYFVLSVDRPEPRARGGELSAHDLEMEMEIGGEERRMKIDQLEALIGQVTARGLVDEHRIAITGMSDGSETLFWALAVRHYAAAVTSSPPLDPLHWWFAPDTFRASLASSIGLTGPRPDAPAQEHPWWRTNTPIYYADRIATPVLMNLPESEALYGLPLRARLQDRRVPTEMYIYPDAAHLKWRVSELYATQMRAIAWIDFWLQNRNDIDAQDRDRFARWRRLQSAWANPNNGGAPQ
jgi:dienelactone hydrolase